MLQIHQLHVVFQALVLTSERLLFLRCVRSARSPNATWSVVMGVALAQLRQVATPAENGGISGAKKVRFDFLWAQKVVEMGFLSVCTSKKSGGVSAEKLKLMQFVCENCLKKLILTWKEWIWNRWIFRVACKCVFFHKFSWVLSQVPVKVVFVLVRWMERVCSCAYIGC